MAGGERSRRKDLHPGAAASSITASFVPPPAPHHLPKQIHLHLPAHRSPGRSPSIPTHPRQLAHGLWQVLVQGDVPVGVVLAGEGFEADLLQLVELCQAQLGRLRVALVAEAGQDMGVLGPFEAVGIGDDGVSLRPLRKLSVVALLKTYLYTRVST